MISKDNPFSLPIYIGVYRYKETPYRIIVNGLNGNLVGTSPIFLDKGNGCYPNCYGDYTHHRRSLFMKKENINVFIDAYKRAKYFVLKEDNFDKVPENIDFLITVDRMNLTNRYTH